MIINFMDYLKNKCKRNPTTSSQNPREIPTNTISLFLHKEDAPYTVLEKYENNSIFGLSSEIYLINSVREYPDEGDGHGKSISFPNLDDLHFQFTKHILKHTYNKLSRIYYVTKKEFRFLRTIFIGMDINKIKDDLGMQTIYFFFKRRDMNGTPDYFTEDGYIAYGERFRIVKETKVPPISLTYNEDTNLWTVVD